MARVTHYSDIFPIIGDPFRRVLSVVIIPPKQTKQTEKKKSFTSSVWLVLVLKEFGKYLLYIFFPPCKTLYYIVFPSTAYVLKLVLLGDEVHMIVHYLSDISLCHIIFIHLIYTLFL